MAQVNNTAAAPAPQQMDITIEATPRKTLSVTLVGVDYLITPPKAGFALRMASKARSTDDDAALGVMDDLFEWVRKAFRDQADAVLGRLDDEEDELDINHLTELMSKVIEASSGNPTT